MLKSFQRWLARDNDARPILIDMRPERPRYWHNPADPIQAARIKAAREKRERKAKLRSANAWESRDMNLAHHSYALNPFHVVRS